MRPPIWVSDAIRDFVHPIHSIEKIGRPLKVVSILVHPFTLIRIYAAYVLVRLARLNAARGLDG